MNQSLWRALGFLAICIEASTGFFHELSRKSFTFANLTEESYFGYSITYLASDRSLIVSAPRANIVGQVYTIDIDTDAIEPVETPKELLENTENITDKNFLLGATVKAGLNFFVMCAPRFARTKVLVFEGNIKPMKLELINGLCFVSARNISLRRLTPEFALKFPAHYANASVITWGWSIDISPSNKVLVGGPVIRKGFVQVYNNGMSKNAKPVTLEIPNDMKYNFGYSIASGNYFDDRIDSIYHAVSTTVGSVGSGKVFFYKSRTDAKIKFSIKIMKVGSTFGASLCTVNLGHRRDSLLVGAPTHVEDLEGVDRGAVYVYVPDNTAKVLNELKIIIGQSDKAYFGSAIANLGDMDGDMKDEVAIGAPYENDGHGVVYIYSGAGLLDLNLQGDQMLIQRIQPERTAGLRSFGFSLTALQDYDENGCNELAVGAPGSNAALVFRCFAYITINLQAQFPTNAMRQQVRRNDTFFTFQSCVDVTYPKKAAIVQAKIRVTVDIIHPNAKLVTENNTRQMTYYYEEQITKDQITKDQIIYCKDVKVFTPIRGNYDRLLTYTISASLPDDPRSDPKFDAARVLLSKQSVLSLEGQESLADCKRSDGQCEPVLSVVYNANMSNLYTLGSTMNGSFSFTIHNEGETAYTACLLVIMEGAPLLQQPLGCSLENEDDLICTSNIPLMKGEKWETGSITLDTSGLTSKDDKITVYYTIFNHCNDRSNNSKSFEEEFILISSTDGLSITGESEPGDVVDIFSESSQLRHVFTITNDGPTTWAGIEAELVLTRKPNVHYDKNIVIKTDDDRPGYCSIVNTTPEAEHASCDPIYLKSNDKIKIIVPLTVSPVSGNGTVTTQNISTTLALNVMNKLNMKFSVVSTLRFMELSVPLWIIVTACLIGIVLVILLGYTLYELGVFQVKKKDDLKKLKRAVHRQSVHRMSMRQSRRASGRDVDETKPFADTIAEQEEEGITQQNTALIHGSLVGTT